MQTINEFKYYDRPTERQQTTLTTRLHKITTKPDPLLADEIIYHHIYFNPAIASDKRAAFAEDLTTWEAELHTGADPTTRPGYTKFLTITPTVNGQEQYRYSEIFSHQTKLYQCLGITPPTS